MAFLKKVTKAPGSRGGKPAKPAFNLKVDARVDDSADLNSDKYQKQDIERHKANLKALQQHHDSMTDAKAGKMVRTSIQSQMLKSKARLMEYGFGQKGEVGPGFYDHSDTGNTGSDT